MTKQDGVVILEMESFLPSGRDQYNNKSYSLEFSY